MSAAPTNDHPTPTRHEPFLTLVLRGLLAGVLAGLLAGAVAFVVGEPNVDSAIAYEEAQAAAAESADHSHDGVAEEAAGGHSHGDDSAVEVTRGMQKFGLFLATTLSGAALGALLGAVIYLVRRAGLLARHNESVRVLLVTGACYLAVVLVPFLLYPANPPAVGDPDTINARTLQWVAAVVLGAVAVIAAGYAARAVAGAQPALKLAAPVLAGVVVVAIGWLLLPNAEAAPEGFSASLMWSFRLSSLATTATLWFALAVIFAALTERTLSAGRRSAVTQD
nr:CbtA family protein [Millisia brevis]